MNKKILFYLIIFFQLVAIAYILSSNRNEIQITSNFIANEEYIEHPLGCTIKSNFSNLTQELIPNFEQDFDGFLVKLPLTHIKIN